MAGISHFMVPADDVARAKKFYNGVLGWTITPVHDTPEMPGMDAMQYHEIRTGMVKAGTLSSGGLYKRHTNEPVLSFAEVQDIDAAVARVEKLGGKITMPKTAIPGVGLVAMVLDSEGNMFGIWKPDRK